MQIYKYDNGRDHEQHLHTKKWLKRKHISYAVYSVTNS